MVPLQSGFSQLHLLSSYSYPLLFDFLIRVFLRPLEFLHHFLSYQSVLLRLFLRQQELLDHLLINLFQSGSHHLSMYRQMVPQVVLILLEFKESPLSQ